MDDPLLVHVCLVMWRIGWHFVSATFHTELTRTTMIHMRKKRKTTFSLTLLEICHQQKIYRLSPFSICPLKFAYNAGKNQHCDMFLLSSLPPKKVTLWSFCWGYIQKSLQRASTHMYSHDVLLEKVWPSILPYTNQKADKRHQAGGHKVQLIITCAFRWE